MRPIGTCVRDLVHEDSLSYKFRQKVCPLIITPSIARILLTYEEHKLKFMSSSYNELHLHINRINYVKNILKKIISFFKRFIKKVQAIAFIIKLSCHKDLIKSYIYNSVYICKYQFFTILKYPQLYIRYCMCIHRTFTLPLTFHFNDKRFKATNKIQVSAIKHNQEP